MRFWGRFWEGRFLGRIYAQLRLCRNRFLRHVRKNNPRPGPKLGVRHKKHPKTPP